MNETGIPKIIKEDTMTVQGLKIRVCVLDNGQRIIPEDDFKKALGWLGLTDDEIKQLLTPQEKIAYEDA